MDYYADDTVDNDSYNRHRQEQQQLSSEYGVETIDDYNNSADYGANQMKPDGDNRDLSSSGKLFVGGVSWETTEDSFADYFNKFGELLDSVIITDRISGRRRGFGFVTFADPAVAERVLGENHIIDGRKVELKRTVPRQIELKSMSKTKKIFVGGLSASLTEDELKEYFSVYGEIVEHQIMYDHSTGRSRGFGFVTFQTEEAVDRIFSEDKTHELGDKQVEIKMAEPRRGGRDYSNDAAKPYHSQGAGGRYGYEEVYNGKGTGDYSGYGGYAGYGAYAGYGGYGGNYMGNSAGFYGSSSYGGYGYGYGYGGAMYGFGYGAAGYGTMGMYDAAAAYGNGKGYANSFSGAKGSGTNGSLASRYHPYQK